MSVNFEVPIFGLTSGGKKIKIGKMYRTVADAHRVGGKIFYIDSTASGATYTFYDEEAQVISDVRVGDTPYAYSVTGTPVKEKFYVFNNQLATSKTWTYRSGGSWVYESLGTGTAIGDGKTNTATVLAASSGAYAAADNTIWKVISLLRSTSTGGCDDWFVSSKDEVEALRNAVDRDGDPLVSWFINNYIWTSSETINEDARYWDSNNNSWNYGKKYTTITVFGARSF